MIADHGFGISSRLRPGPQAEAGGDGRRAVARRRSPVREALNGLAALGVLDIRHGRGVFVAASPSAHWGHEAVVPALIRAQTNALIEARLVVQPEVARLAAERRTEAD